MQQLHDCSSIAERFVMVLNFKGKLTAVSETVAFKKSTAYPEEQHKT
jgi:hypothetical protein